MNPRFHPYSRKRPSLIPYCQAHRPHPQNLSPTVQGTGMQSSCLSQEPVPPSKSPRQPRPSNAASPGAHTPTSTSRMSTPSPPTLGAQPPPTHTVNPSPTRGPAHEVLDLVKPEGPVKPNPTKHSSAISLDVDNCSLATQTRRRICLRTSMIDRMCFHIVIRILPSCMIGKDIWNCMIRTRNSSVLGSMLMGSLGDVKRSLHGRTR
jgi:hypothetical protein